LLKKTGNAIAPDKLDVNRKMQVFDKDIFHCHQ